MWWDGVGCCLALVVVVVVFVVVVGIVVVGGGGGGVMAVAVAVAGSRLGLSSIRAVLTTKNGVELTSLCACMAYSTPSLQVFSSKIGLEVNGAADYITGECVASNRRGRGGGGVDAPCSYHSQYKLNQIKHGWQHPPTSAPAALRCRWKLILIWLLWVLVQACMCGSQ